MKPASKTSGNELMDALRDCRQAFCTVGAFSAVINVLLLAPSLYMLQVYDRVLASRNELTLLMLTLLVLGAYGAMAALELVRTFVLVRLGSRLDMKLSRRIYTAAFERNLRQPGQAAGQPLQDLTTVRQFLTGTGPAAFFDAPWLPLYLAVIFLFNVSLGVFALGAAAVLVALAWANERVTRKPLGEAGEAAIAAQQSATNNLRNAEVIQAMGMLPALMKAWQRQHLRFLHLQSQASDKGGMVGALSKFTRTAMQSLVLGFGAMLAIRGDITPGMMIVSSILMGRVLAPVDALIGVWKGWRTAVSAYERLGALLQAHPARAAVMELPKPSGRLKLEAVSALAPGASTPTLRNVSLSLSGGELLCVIGPSGAGKSALARVMVGVWPASSGSVRLDEAEMAQWERSRLGPAIGYLPQDVELFAGTVAQNIARMGETDAAMVVEAARSAGVHEMILRMPQGYETVLKDGGAGLSGGQKQRIGLARALYGQPCLVVLDEPNSNLDDAGEHALVAALQALRARGCTVVMITHRSAALSVASHVMLMVDGEVRLLGERDRVLAAMAQAQQGVAARGNLRPVPGTAADAHDRTVPGAQGGTAAAA